MKILLAVLLLCGCADRLAEVNQQVNAHQYIAGKYDCKSFAEDKYKILAAEGYKNMKFVLTSHHNIETGINEPHVVLNVDGVILDNIYKNPYPATKKLSQGISPEYWLKARKLLEEKQNVNKL